jgi:hypothetical protein
MLSVIRIHSKIGGLASRVIFVPDISNVFLSLRKRVAQEDEIDVPALSDLVECSVAFQLPVTIFISP